jgi:NADPH2:quinone reductase
MKAYRVGESDGEVRLEDVEHPVPRAGEVLVRIAACGLNFADLLMLKGTYQDMPARPYTPGMELSGTIEARGDGVTDLETGTRVAVFAGHGGLAEYGVFPAQRCVPLPGSMDFAEAAGFLVAYGTSHLALTRRARLRDGERLLVIGAGGGVGLSAVELGAALGAEVIAAARGPDKLAAARTAGAHHLVDLATADLTAEVRALGSADVVYDAVGGQAFDAALRAIRPEGRVLLIGFASGDVPQIAANRLLVKNVDVVGVDWGGYLRFHPEALDRSLRDCMDLYRAGRLRPAIGATLPFDRAPEALDLLRRRAVPGKIVVTTGAVLT